MSQLQTDRPLRFVTASSLFDGHDVSINIIRRILQTHGCEVVHLGHNRSVDDIIQTALQEDAQAIAISSYQGGHVEFLRYMLQQLNDNSAQHIRVFAGGGGVITTDEIERLEHLGVARVYTPEMGQVMGLNGIIEDMMLRCDRQPLSPFRLEPARLIKDDPRYLAQCLSALENHSVSSQGLNQLRQAATSLPQPAPVLGITGTGGSGKSSLTDELILRYRIGQQNRLRIAVLAIDPSRRKTGGALLGDRIRMNAIDDAQIFFRSIATRDASNELPPTIEPMIDACRLAGFDLIIVETPGIGQGDAAIAPLADCTLYVMTPEYGAQSQLEKIDMLDYADIVAINKFDRNGAQDALRDVARQWQRNHECFELDIDQLPVFGVSAAHFNDDGVTALYQALNVRLAQLGLRLQKDALPTVTAHASSHTHQIVPPERSHYLSEIAACIRDYHRQTHEQSAVARRLQHIAETAQLTSDVALQEQLAALQQQQRRHLSRQSRQLLDGWDELQSAYGSQQSDADAPTIAQSPRRWHETLSGSRVPRVALPDFIDHGARLQWLMLENAPGRFPYTAGVFPFRRDNEDPTRMFAGEGDAFATNARFKKLSRHSPSKRLSTAFDSVTLYGCDPDERPDIYGKIGNSGVSIATLDDMKELYRGFDLCAPQISVSMTINGPAPTILAMFLNTAIDQQLEKFEQQNQRAPNASERAEIEAQTLQQVRGTVQADILKEDQGQNTCIFSSEFALRMMGDMQQYFIDHAIRRFYSVSISGYHIAEAGANPITQLAFTLANGFTYLEAWLARGMKIDDFAPNLSFFFSNGMDAEYSVIGRVARRIWAVALRNRYHANARSQKLKYHIQTSGRSLHAQEMDFNDIRTTLQALIAVNDNCNSLHTNAYDEALTTPTEQSVRRALAIQLIINREWGLSQNENPNQGAFIIDQLTEQVEMAVLQEFERLSERGGVLGAMESGYQRGRIQDESMRYEQRKHDGSLPIVGVNCFINAAAQTPQKIELQRSSDALKNNQIKRLRDFKLRHRNKAEACLQGIRQTALRGDNIFNELMQAVRHCTLGQISSALYDVGGQYRRNM